MMIADRRLVLHIGPHKTASTYIQVNLSRNRERLRKNGWNYPQLGTNGLDGHHHMVTHRDDYLNDGAVYSAELETLRKQAASATQNLVFSSEGMSTWKAEHFERLADLLGFDKIELVYVIRDPMDLIKSFWTEEVKQGRCMGFGDRFAQEFARQHMSGMFNPLKNLTPLDQSPRIRLHIMPFDLVAQNDLDIFEHLCKQVLNLPMILAQHKLPVNIQYRIELTEFLRLLTLKHGGGARKISSNLRHDFIKKTSGKERLAISNLIKTNALHARRVIKVPSNLAIKEQLEQKLKQDFAGQWTMDVTDKPLFSTLEKKFFYYNEYLLWQTEPVRLAVEKMLARLGY